MMLLHVFEGSCFWWMDVFRCDVRATLTKEIMHARGERESLFAVVLSWLAELKIFCG